MLFRSTVTYTATDAAGNVQTCSFDVVITDNEDPVFTACPSDIAQDSDTGDCGAVVTWTAPTFTDNCTGTTLTSTHNSGDAFPIGTTTVTYTATDAAGNVQTCSFDVTVEDVEAPTFLHIPSDTITVCFGENVMWDDIMVSDNCPGVTFQGTHNSGDVFPIGATIVNYTATDVSGNTSDSSFVVFVNELPTIDILSSSSTINVCLGDELTFNAVYESDSSSIDWYFEQDYLGSGDSIYLDDLNKSDGGTYYVQIMDSNGCLNQASIDITLKLCEIIVTGVITPNGDGLNDNFVIEYLSAYPGTEIWIYNRWGAEVYHSEDYQNDWDGRSDSQFNIGGDELPESTYYYLIKLGGEQDNPSNGDIHKGYFYLKREQ